MSNCKVIVAGNLKGGTGKSTVAVNIACEFARRGGRVCLIDTDSQQTSAKWLKQLDVDVRAETSSTSVVSDALQLIELISTRKQNHDFIILDLPAVIGPAFASALLVADIVLIPTSSTPIDIDATKGVLQRVQIAAKERKGIQPHVILVHSRVGEREPNAAALQELRDHYDVALGPEIPFSDQLAMGFNRGYWAGSDQVGGDVLIAIRKLADQITGLLNSPKTPRIAGFITPSSGPNRAASPQQPVPMAASQPRNNRNYQSSREQTRDYERIRQSQSRRFSQRLGIGAALLLALPAIAIAAFFIQHTSISMPTALALSAGFVAAACAAGYVTAVALAHAYFTLRGH